jgi:hypothetical protein
MRSLRPAILTALVVLPLPLGAAPVTPDAAQAAGARFSIEGQVLDATRAPIAGARVTAVTDDRDVGPSTVTDERGAFTLTGRSWSVHHQGRCGRIHRGDATCQCPPDRCRVAGICPDDNAYQKAFVSSATIAARAGAQVGQVPHHTLSLWNNYRVHSRLAAGVGIVHRSDMFAAIDDTVTLPGYTRADAATYVHLTKQGAPAGER